MADETAATVRVRNSAVLTESALLARVASALKADPRVGTEKDIIIVGQSVEVRARETLVVVAPTAALREGGLEIHARALAEGRAGLLLIGPADRALLDRFPAAAIVGLLDAACCDDALQLAVLGLAERVELRQRDERKAKWLSRFRTELGELLDIARALSQERSIERLLDLILEKSRFITSADAGSIYVVEGDDPDPTRRILRFKTSQNDSRAFESSEFTMPVSTRSIAGAAVVTRRPITLPDVYEIPADAPYGFDRSFDEKTGYRTRSTIAVPMISAQAEVIGVIQLINRKVDPKRPLATPEDFEENVVAFDDRAADLLETLASQAGIVLENAMLYDEIRRIFEGFVRASVQAIEQRDPTTSGHSLRVSLLSCGLAQVVDRTDTGPFGTATFTRRELKELEYASLLHDFGKIGVRERVLVKAKKLHPQQLDAVQARLDYMLKSAEADMLRRKVELIQQGAGSEALEAVDLELVRRSGELAGALAVILQANEPTVLSEGDFSRIVDVGAMTFADSTGATRALLGPEEIAALHVRRGSLSEDEIEEIRSHVTHTISFLSKIPWGKAMSNIPLIAGAHHEKLNGSGYPGGIGSEAIPLQSKIMTVADIFDALTARDRPYKKAIPVERALQILDFEVKDGNVDGELVRLFKDAKVFEVSQGVS